MTKAEKSALDWIRSVHDDVSTDCALDFLFMHRDALLREKAAFQQAAEAAYESAKAFSDFRACLPSWKEIGPETRNRWADSARSAFDREVQTYGDAFADTVLDTLSRLGVERASTSTEGDSE